MMIKEVSKEKLRAALNWLRGFLEAMMGAQAYDEATFQQQLRDLLGNAGEDEQSPHLDASRGDEEPAPRPRHSS